MKNITLLYLLSCLLVSNINDNCKVVALNHIKSDNAIGILKALGYSVIDYTQDEETTSFNPKLDNFEDAPLEHPGLTVIKFPSGRTEYLDAGLDNNEE